MITATEKLHSNSQLADSAIPIDACSKKPVFTTATPLSPKTIEIRTRYEAIRANEVDLKTLKTELPARQ